MSLTKESRGLDASGKEQPDEGEGGGEEMNDADAEQERALAARAN